MNAGILGLAVGSTRYYLSRAQRFRAVRICVLLVATSCLDVVGLATLVPVMLVAAEPGGVAKSRLFAPVYHALHFQSERQFLLTLIAGIFLFFLLKNLFTTWVNHVLTAFTVDLGTSVARTQVDKYLHFPFWHFNQLGSSNLTLNAMELPLQYVGMVVRPLFVLFSEMAVVLAIVVTILLFKPLLLGLLAVVLVPATLLTYRALRQRTQAIGNEFNALRLVLYGTIGDLFTGVVELKLAGKQYQFRDRFLANQRGLQELDAESYRYSLLPLRVIEMVAIAGGADHLPVRHPGAQSVGRFGGPGGAVCGGGLPRDALREPHAHGAHANQAGHFHHHQARSLPRAGLQRNAPPGTPAAAVPAQHRVRASRLPVSGRAGPHAARHQPAHP